MVKAKIARQYDALHEALPWHDGTFSDWSKDRDADHLFHYRDGVTLWVAEVDYDPGGTWLSRAGSAEEPTED